MFTSLQLEIGLLAAHYNWYPFSHGYLENVSPDDRRSERMLSERCWLFSDEERCSTRRLDGSPGGRRLLQGICRGVIGHAPKLGRRIGNR
jgi:hypothetical protein